MWRGKWRGLEFLGNNMKDIGILYVMAAIFDTMIKILREYIPDENIINLLENVIKIFSSENPIKLNVDFINYRAKI